MRGPNSKAARALLRQDMPLGEVRAVLEAADPAVVHRYLELHRERLEEQIAERGRVLDVVERILTENLEANDNAKTRPGFASQFSLRPDRPLRRVVCTDACVRDSPRASRRGSAGLGCG